jgi:hypothetical protein
MRILLSVIFALALLSSASSAHAQFGIAAGLNFDRISDIDARDADVTFENASGFHVGAFFDLGLGPVAIRPGVFYRNIRGIEYDLTSLAVGARPSFDLNLVEVPIDIRIRTTTPIVRPYALAGPVIRFASTPDEDFEDAIENLSVAANIGAGVEIRIPMTGIRLFPELRYSFGVTRFTRDEFEILGRTIRSEGRQNDSSVMLRLGIGL